MKAAGRSVLEEAQKEIISKRQCKKKKKKKRTRGKESRAVSREDRGIVKAVYKSGRNFQQPWQIVSKSATGVTLSSTNVGRRNQVETGEDVPIRWLNFQ